MNMSSGGMFIKTNHLLPIDAEFALNLQLPDDSEIMTINGRVVWTKSVSNVFPLEWVSSLLIFCRIMKKNYLLLSIKTAIRKTVRRRLNYTCKS